MERYGGWITIWNTWVYLLEDTVLGSVSGIVENLSLQRNQLDIKAR
jgi:hypothetical protein